MMTGFFRTGKRGGFSLMEILIALAVLMLGLLGVLALFPVAIDASGQAAEATQCALLARSVKNALKLGMMNRDDTIILSFYE